MEAVDTVLEASMDNQENFEPKSKQDIVYENCKPEAESSEDAHLDKKYVQNFSSTGSVHNENETTDTEFSIHNNAGETFVISDEEGSPETKPNIPSLDYSIPEIMITADSHPANWKTLYDEESSSEEGNYEYESDDEELDKKSALEHELDKIKDRLINEITKSNKLEEKLDKAKSVTELFESKLHIVQDEYRSLLEKYQKQEEMLNNQKEVHGNEVVSPPVIKSKEGSEINNDPRNEQKISELHDIIEKLKQEIKELDSSRGNEINDLVEIHKEAIVAKDKELCELRNNITKLSLELHEEQERYRLATKERIISGAVEKVYAEHKGKPDHDDSEESEEEMRALKEEMKSLKSKLIDQEELQRKLKILQQQSIDLNTLVREQQKKYEEAVGTLRMVQENYSSRNRVLNYYNVDEKSRLISKFKRENPEGESADHKVDHKDAPVVSCEKACQSEEYLSSVVQLELTMKALKKSQEAAEELGTEVTTLRNDLENSRLSSAERGKKLNEFQREILGLRDSNEALKTKLEQQEKEIAEMTESERNARNELSVVKNQLDKEDKLKSDKSKYALKLAKTKGKYGLVKEKLLACKTELKRLKVDQVNSENLINSIPKLHEKIDNDEKKIKELQAILKNKEEMEKSNLNLIEAEKAKLEEEKMKWKSRLEARLTESNSSPDVINSDELFLESGEGSAMEQIPQSLGTTNTSYPRPKSADGHHVIAHNKGMVSEDHYKIQTQCYGRFKRNKYSRQIFGVQRPTSSPPARVRPPLVSKRGSYVHTRAMTVPQKTTCVLPYQPRVLLWGADKEEPAKKLIAINDRVLVTANVGMHNDNTITVPGTVRFIGPIEGIGEEIQIGIKLDEPVGDHDGKFEGVRYFHCQPLHGKFVKLEDILRVLNPKAPYQSTSPRYLLSA